MRLPFIMPAALLLARAATAETTAVSMTFQPMAGDTFVDCTTALSGLGPDGTATIGLSDLRFYVSDITLTDDSGETHPLTLDETPFQLRHPSGQLALVDLTGTDAGTCQPGAISLGEGTARTNDTITGAVEAANFTGITFHIGVPQDVMRDVIASGSVEDAPSPLSEMQWNWASGYRHFVLNHTVDMADGTYGEGYLHIGSTNCGPAEGKALSDRDRCERPNTAEVVLSVTDPANIKVGIDIPQLVADMSFIAQIRDMKTKEVIGERPGTSCHASPMEPHCGQLFEHLGLDLKTGAVLKPADTVFTAIP